METEFQYTVGVHVLIEQALPVAALDTKALSRVLSITLRAAKVEHRAIDPIGEFSCAAYRFETNDPPKAIKALSTELEILGLSEFAVFGVLHPDEREWSTVHGAGVLNDFGTLFGGTLGIEEARAIRRSLLGRQPVPVLRAISWTCGVLADVTLWVKARLDGLNGKRK